MRVNINNASKFRRPRMVENMLQAKFADWSQYDGATTLTKSGDGGYTAVSSQEGTFTIGASAGVSYASNGSTDLVAGKFYALSCEITAVTGTYAGTFMKFQAITAVTEGVSEKAGATVGKHMVVFQASTTESLILRFGLVDSGSDCSVTMKNIMCQEMTDMSELAPYVMPLYNITTDEYTPMALDFYDTGYWDATNLLYVPGTKSKFPVRRSAVGIVISDSFTNSVNEYGMQITRDLQDTGIYVNGQSGRTLATIASEIDTILGDNTFQMQLTAVSGDETYNSEDYWPYPKFAVIQAGVNDLNTTADFSIVGAMMGYIETIVQRCKAKDVIPILCSAPPWAAAAGFSNLNDDQMKTDAFNGKLKSYCEANGYMFVDIYTALEGDVNADQIANTANGDAVDYTTDDLHPDTTAGIAQMAATIEPFIRKLPA